MIQWNPVHSSCHLHSGNPWHTNVYHWQLITNFNTTPQLYPDLTSSYRPLSQFYCQFYVNFPPSQICVATHLLVICIFYRNVYLMSLYLLFFDTGLLCMLGKHAPTELHLQPLLHIFSCLIVPPMSWILIPYDVPKLLHLPRSPFHCWYYPLGHTCF